MQTALSGLDAATCCDGLLLLPVPLSANFKHAYSLTLIVSADFHSRQRNAKNGGSSRARLGVRLAECLGFKGKHPEHGYLGHGPGANRSACCLPLPLPPALQACRGLSALLPCSRWCAFNQQCPCTSLVRAAPPCCSAPPPMRTVSMRQTTTKALGVAPTRGPAAAVQPTPLRTPRRSSRWCWLSTRS